MSLDPKIAMWLKIIYTILTAISSGTLVLTGLVSPAAGTQIVALAGTMGVLLGIVMSAYSSSAPGPLAPADPPVVVAAQKVADLPSNAGPAVIKSAKDQAVAAVASHQP